MAPDLGRERRRRVARGLHDAQVVFVRLGLAVTRHAIRAQRHFERQVLGEHMSRDDERLAQRPTPDSSMQRRVR